MVLDLKKCVYKEHVQHYVDIQVSRVRARLDPLVLERWNSITVLFTRSHQGRRLVQKRPSMCYYVCVIMHVKDP